jgi:flagellar basal body rod protein FlgC
MDFLKSIAIAASGMRAQAGRMRIISENIANAESTASSPGGDPYRRRIVTFRDEIDREIDAHRGQARPYSDRYVGLPRAARTGQPHGRRQGRREISQRQIRWWR